jgi:competence protein ComEA
MKRIFAILMLCSFAVLADPININQADTEAISKALTGVGPKKAEAIVQYRKEHGAFKTLKELENVKGIGEKTAQANEKNIVFGDAAVTPEVKTAVPDPKVVVPEAKPSAGEAKPEAAGKSEKVEPASSPK